jgi:hypothetical protein
VESEDLVYVGDLTSNSFLDDCTTKTEVVDKFRDIFGAASNIRLEVRYIRNGRYVSSNLYASDVDFRVIGDTFAGPREESFILTLYLRRESGSWLNYGNQICVAPPKGMRSPTRWNH